MNYITLTPGKSAKILFEGYFYNKAFYVYLSSTSNANFPYVSAISLFPNNTSLQVNFPEASGYPINTYSVQSNNFIELTVGNLPTLSATYDILIGNNAGYSLLSNKGYLINYTN
jgi:hypothetical protein